MQKKTIFVGIVLICALIIISGCVKPPSLREEFYGKSVATDKSEDTTKESDDSKEKSEEDSTSKDKDSKDETKGTGGKGLEDTELKAKDILKGDNNIAKVKTLGESSEIDATFFGRNEVFTVPYNDIDAIIFDISKKFAVSLNDIRLILEVDGNPYLRPSQKEELEIEEKGQEVVFNETDDNPYAELPYSFFRNDSEPGYLRAVGCDIKNNVVKFKLHNFKDVVVRRYRIVKPKVQDPLTVYFNKKRLIDSFCDGVLDLEPNQTIECFHSGVSFIKTKQKGSIYDEIEYNEDFTDELYITQPGYNEKFTFVCTEEASKSNDTSSNQSSNSTQE